MKKHYFNLLGAAVIAASIWFVPAAYGQVSAGALLDAQIRHGGADSSPFVNQTPDDGWVVYVPHIRLFFDAAIGDHWFAATSIQSDYFTSSTINPPFLGTLNINWLPMDQSSFTLTLGRFVTPYGLYSEKLLSSENSFVSLPLSYTYRMGVDRQQGLYRFPGVGLPNQNMYSEGLSLIYQRGYSEGLMVSNVIGDDTRFSYFLSTTLASAGGYYNFSPKAMPGFTGRLVFQPFTWGSIGLSSSYGSYLVRHSLNSAISKSELYGFKQFLIGTDLSLSYHYYSLNLALNWNRWEAPSFDNQGSLVDDDLNARVFHFLAEGKVRLPFWVGAYTAGRFEWLNPVKLSSGTFYGGNSETWNNAIARVEFALGYRVNRKILLKTSYRYAVNEGLRDWDDNVFAVQVSAGF